MFKKILISVFVFFILGFLFLAYFGVLSNPNGGCLAEVKRANKFCGPMSYEECQNYSEGSNSIPQEHIRYSDVYCGWTGPDNTRYPNTCRVMIGCM